ncbi:spore coat U domain-containing protein [Acinetobacter nectaris]|uniref:Csu type fimbrial protein n=1 Tax=Acinetobacter nectaris TaxID=1219382 RepID=UPI001F24BD9C|nr:spore coat U domain-containing protein [Acinetobacter nectaris]MCF9035492.1 spore coat protein U domain-containing protein [Acinetobacter nectaris]
MKRAIFCIIGLSFSISMHSYAGSATGTLNVSATVVPSCIINTSPTGAVTNAALNFGQIDSLTNDFKRDTSAGGTQISVLCNNSTAWQVSLDGGQYASQSQRRMGNGGSEFIPYNLYSDSGYSKAIGIGTKDLAGTGTGNLQSLNVYGLISAGTPIPSAGTYNDTVTMTITY